MGVINYVHSTGLQLPASPSKKEGPTPHQVLYKYKPKQWTLSGTFYTCSSKKAHTYGFSPMDAETPYRRQNALSLFGKEPKLSRNTMIQSNSCSKSVVKW